MLGDDQTLASITELLGLLAAIGVTPPDVSEFDTFGEWFGPEADCDGDGCTNREEYVAYQASGAATYV
ncbi:hypothetical protein EO238_34160, partial [Citrobacter sp. AAK_AS5]